jgi:hypothetical protein
LKGVRYVIFNVRLEINRLEFQGTRQLFEYLVCYHGSAFRGGEKNNAFGIGSYRMPFSQKLLFNTPGVFLEKRFY